MYDTVIKNALIYDGTGKNAYYGNVAVCGDKIAYVGTDDPGCAKETVDAEGQAISPGFIDVHSHSDYMIVSNPHRVHVLQMGVTTELAGNCGISRSPALSGISGGAISSIKHGGEADHLCASAAEEIDEVKSLPLGVNQQYFTGHGVLRADVMGVEDRRATDAEITRMQELLDTAMKEGTAGISTGLSYVPGIYSDTKELAMLAKTAGEAGGIYTTHSRSESMGLFDSVRECIEIARIANAPVNISHFKCVGKVFWSRCEEALSMIDDAIAEGLDISLDAYPYIACCTTTLSAIPPRFLDKGVDAFAESLNDPDVVKAIYHEIYEVNDPSWDNSMYYVGLENFLIARADATPWAKGLTYAEAAKKMGLSPFDGMIELQKRNRGQIMDVRFGMCEENVETILSHPKCMVGSDGPYESGDTFTHPRSFGTFPRYLGRYIREKGIHSREEGIRRLTSMPAKRYGLLSKGELKRGYDADLVLFDYDRIRDHADYKDPFAANDGISRVYVGGRLALKDNEPTGVWNGKYIYPSHKTGRV